VLGAAIEHRLVRVALGLPLGFELALGFAQPLPPRRGVGELGRQLVAARLAIELVLGGVDRLGLLEISRAICS
jgi:hypothetical protein